MPLHHSQTITYKKDCAIISFYIRPTVDFVMELLHYSESVEIIKPLSLRKRFFEIYRKAMKRNM
ncbi:MAG: WYL domain-containing protein [Bacteroidales bacterium]|nr:WYL domain-containing protein [Bacteroidales bacterium]